MSKDDKSTTIEKLVSPEPPARVVPNADRPFWDAIDSGTLVLAECACGARYARIQACLRCGATAEEMSWTPASGNGAVRSFIVFDKSYHPYFAASIPYVVATITLEEGPEIVTNVVDIDPVAVRIGMAVRLVVRKRGEYSLPFASANI